MSRLLLSTRGGEYDGVRSSAGADSPLWKSSSEGTRERSCSTSRKAPLEQRRLLRMGSGSSRQRPHSPYGGSGQARPRRPDLSLRLLLSAPRRSAGQSSRPLRIRSRRSRMRSSPTRTRPRSRNLPWEGWSGPRPDTETRRGRQRSLPTSARPRRIPRLSRTAGSRIPQPTSSTSREAPDQSRV